MPPPTGQHLGALEIEVSGDADRCVVLLRGDLDLRTADELRGALHEYMAGGARLVVIDLAELDFLAVAGLRVFMDAHEVLDGCGARLVLARAQRSALRILLLTGLDEILAVEGAAERSLSRRVELDDVVAVRRVG